MLPTKDTAIQNLLFVLHQYRNQERFFGKRSEDWNQIERPAIYIPKDGNGMDFRDFTFNKTKLDIRTLWANSTLIKDMTLYIHPFGNAKADWALLGASTHYNYTLGDKGSCLAIFFNDFKNLDNTDKILLEGTSPTAVLTHYVLQLGEVETDITKPLPMPNFTMPTYRVNTTNGRIEHLTEAQILSKWPYLQQLFEQATSIDDEIDITFSIGPFSIGPFPNPNYIHIARVRSEHDG